MSLPSSMANFVPCDRLLQKAYFHVAYMRMTYKVAHVIYHPGVTKHIPGNIFNLCTLRALRKKRR